MYLHLIKGERRFVQAPNAQSAPLRFQPMVFGDVVPVNLFVYERLSRDPAQLTPIDVEAFEINLTIGPPNVRPELGYWVMTLEGLNSLPVPLSATRYDVATTLTKFLGETVTVTGGGGSFIATMSTLGVRTTPTVAFTGFTLSQAFIVALSVGTATTPAQYLIQILELAPARIAPEQWEDGDTSLTNSLALDGGIWDLIIDQKAQFGFYKLTVDSRPVSLPWNSSPFDIQTAIRSIGFLCDVRAGLTGGIDISFQVEISSFVLDDGGLAAAPFQTGNLDLSLSGLRELLDGLSWRSVDMSVTLIKDGISTTATCGIIVKMPVNQPATVAIDTPTNSAISFELSADESYLNAYQDGVFIGKFPLIAGQAPE